MKKILIERIKNEKYMDKQSEFREIINSPEYKQFEHSVLLKYYGSDFFTSVNGYIFPTYTIEGIPIDSCFSVTDLDVICDYDNSSFVFDINNHRDYTRFKWYDEYSIIVCDKLRFPDRPGYMLDKINFNDVGKIDSISVHMGTYGKTVFSNHVLEYELYRAFLEYKDKDISQPTI